MALASIDSSDLPSWQLRSHFHLSITNATLAFCGNTGAHDWIDDRPCRRVAHHAARRQVRVGAASQVERVTIKDRIATDDIRRQCGDDVQFAIADERVVARAGRHLEFTVPAPSSSVTQQNDT